MTLKAYREKRKFNKTKEPKGRIRKSSSGRMFVVQKHASRRLHYDFRLEAGGVLKSWAVPKGPSYDPAEKRLAIQVEDHPLEYANFEGEIAENQYGAGTVMVWDKGTWTPIGDWKKGLEAGSLKFYLEGKKLKGNWALVQFKGRKKPDSRNWLLIKASDKEGKESRRSDITAKKRTGVRTGKSMEEIKGQIEGSSKKTANPRKKKRASGKGRGTGIRDPLRLIFP